METMIAVSSDTEKVYYLKNSSSGIQKNESRTWNMYMYIVSIMGLLTTAKSRLDLSNYPSMDNMIKCAIYVQFNILDSQIKLILT